MTTKKKRNPPPQGRLARCPARRFKGGKGVSSPDMHIYFVSMKAFVSTLTTTGSPRTRVSVERAERQSRHEKTLNPLLQGLVLIHFSHPTSPFAVTQAVSRLLPFIVNAMVARRLTPEEFGVPTVHFQLLSTVILTSREGFRRALMRDTKATEDSSQGTFAWAYMYSDSLAL